jgi:hypothetical protein
LFIIDNPLTLAKRILLSVSFIKNAIVRLFRMKLDRRVMVFMFFVVVATIFWFLNVLGLEYTTSLSYPVRYTNFPENKVIVGELPSSLDLTVNAYGYTLVKYYVSRQLLPIVFDVGSFSLTELPGSETSNFYILSSVARTSIAGQLGADINIIDIEPDTLFFNFTETISRSLPVRPEVDLGFQQQFMLKGNISAEPDSVTVSGPASIIDTMKFVPTQLLSLKNLNESVYKEVRIQDFDLLSYSFNEALVHIPVEQFTEAKIKVSLEIINIPEGMKMKTFPSDITVSYLVALSDYEKVNTQQFNAIVDYESIVEGQSRLEVSLLKQPELVRAVRFYPVAVDFLIER